MSSNIYCRAENVKRFFHRRFRIAFVKFCKFKSQIIQAIRSRLIFAACGLVEYAVLTTSISAITLKIVAKTGGFNDNAQASV